MSDNILPEEMVLEILLRIPSKSLIRFKSVCKPWCTLFSCSQFMAKHLLPDRDNGDLLLIKRRDETRREYVLSVLSDDTLDVDHSHSLLLPPFPKNPDPKYPDPDFQPWWFTPEIEILGSCCCNGFICLYYVLRTPYIVLWSPFTGDVKIVPPCDVPYPQGGTSYCQSELGFGYDANSQDYKVIIVTPTTIDDMSVDGFKVDVYSSTTDSWRGSYFVGGELPAIILPSNSATGVYTNGVFSWWACHYVEDGLEHIMWFRMSDESFGTTRLPPNRNRDEDPVYFRKYDMKTLALNDRFGLIMFDWGKNIEKCFHVWVLLEFGVEDSWTQLFTLHPVIGIERPVWFWKNGKMIMEDTEGNLVLCDPFSQEMKSLNIGGLANGKSDIQIVSIPYKYIY